MRFPAQTRSFAYGRFAGHGLLAAPLAGQLEIAQRCPSGWTVTEARQRAQRHSRRRQVKFQRDQMCVYIHVTCRFLSSTPLHLAVRSNNAALIEILLGDPRTDCERQDKEGFVPLWYALQNQVDRIFVA